MGPSPQCAHSTVPHSMWGWQLAQCRCWLIGPDGLSWWSQTIVRSSRCRSASGLLAGRCPQAGQASAAGVAHAIQDASDGHPGTALLRLALLAGIIAVLGWLWIRLLGRALVSVDTTTQSSAVHGTALPFGRFGLRGTVAARFWVYQRRDPAAIIYWGITAVVMAAVSVSTIRSPSYLGALLGSAGFGAVLIAILHANSIGVTGPA